MSYEEAPATALIAKACCVCGRPLLEAESIKSGIGPICAERTGFFRESVPPEVRARVNTLVYELAAYQRSPEAVPRLVELRELGFGEIADRIEERLADLVEIEIVLRPAANRLLVNLPRVEADAWTRLLVDLRTLPGRKVEKVPGEKRSEMTIPNGRRPILALHRVLSRHFAGRVARSPKSMFVVPTVEELERTLAAHEERRAAGESEGIHA